MTGIQRILFALGMVLLATSRSACAADVFAEATAGRDRVVSPAYFGTHFHRLVLRPGEQAVRTQWPSIRFGTVRLWDATTRWADLAPRPGQWDFDRLDTYVQHASARGASVLYTLGSTPQWASARPEERCSYGAGCAAEPVRAAHWEEYVRRVAQRYRGLMGAFELWNEPYFSDIPRDRVSQPAFYSGSIASMVELARTARRVLDDVSPSVVLTTPGFVGETERLDLFLGAGGKDSVQVVAYHFYTRNTEEFARRILDVRAVMRRHGIGEMPLWNTEQGIESYPEGAPMPSYVKERLTRREAAARMAQVLIVGAAAGLERFYYYAWDNDHSGMVTRSGDRLPAYDAMARVQDWLIGAQTKGCASPSRGVVLCRTEREGQDSLVLWADQPGERTVKLPAGTQVSAVETLLPDTPAPTYRVQRGMLSVALDPEPVRVVLNRTNAQ